MNAPYRLAPATDDPLCECRYPLGHSVCKRCRHEIPFGRRDGLFRAVLCTAVGASLLAYMAFRVLHPPVGHHSTGCIALQFALSNSYLVIGLVLNAAYERYLGEKVPGPDSRD